MNALSDLATEVKFRERMRGYDYEEVDDYVKQVSRAAVQAQDRIAELEHRLAQRESPEGSDDGDPEMRETLLRTLVLAQRTADSAVSEARSEAKSIIDSAQERAAKTVSEAEAAANERLRSAEERAALMLAESEENGQLILAEAKRTAAAELATERERAQEELRDLEASKAEMTTVVAEIQTRLNSERDTLRGLSDSFQSFVDMFEPVTGIEDDSAAVDEAAAADTEASDAAVDDAKAGDAAEVSAEIAEESVADGEEAAPSAADDTAADQAAEADPESMPSSDSTSRTGDGPAEEALPADVHVDDGDAVPEVPVVAWDDEIGRDRSAGADTAVLEPVAADMVPLGNGSASREPADRFGGEIAAAGPATMPFGVDGPELFDIDAEEDAEFIEQLRQVVSSEAPLPDGDAAMAAFFDHDDGASARSGRR